MPKQKREAEREPLSVERVLRQAIELADESGIHALSMRKLSQALGVEAMSLYNYVANKDEMIEGMIDLIVGEIELPKPGDDWKRGMRRRARSAHHVLLRHPWAAALIESSENPGPMRLRYFDAVLASLLDGGFPVALAYHAFLIMDSYIYGFALQEINWPYAGDERGEKVEELQSDFPAADFPHIAQVMGYVVDRDAKRARSKKPITRENAYAKEFVYGFDLILEGLERRLR